MSTVTTLKRYAAGELAYDDAFDALVRDGHLTGVGARDMLRSPVNTLDKFEQHRAGAVELGNTLVELSSDGHRARAKAAAARMAELPSVWSTDF